MACIGLTNMMEGEGTDAIASQTRGDMFDLKIPQDQVDFVKRIRENIESGREAHKAKLVVVIASGTPVILTEISEIADAVIYAWYPGQAGGYALADVLFGNASPSGRAPMTFVKSLDQLPPFIQYEMTGRTYKYMTEEPLYPFGYGLSYATFEYSGLVAPKSVKAEDSATIKVKVSNTSSVDADEIVQLYVSNEDAGKDLTPIRRLADFKRISLKAGETKEVTLCVEPLSISVLEGEKERNVKSGTVKFSVGGGQPVAKTAAYLLGEYEVVGNMSMDL